MHESRARSVARQIGIFGALTVLVTVLTLLFNLCGPLTVTVFVGMMAGASRRWQWQSIFLSLLCPIVVLALGKVTRLGLDGPQRLSFAAVCLVAFWATYLVTYLVMRMERSSAPAPDAKVSKASSAPPESATSRQPGDTLTVDESFNQLSLRHLQGTWHCDTSLPDKVSLEKVFAITDDKFSLSVVNAGGQAQLVAQGDVVVQGVASSKRLILRAKRPA
jgi:hypothetical protein